MKKTDTEKILEKWKSSNKKNNYQKIIATKEFLHDNSKELVNTIKGQDISFAYFFELGCGMGRNLYYLNKSYPEAEYAGNDLSREECFKYMDESIKDMDFFEFDTLSLFEDKVLAYYPDAVLDSDHLMHLPPESVSVILKNIVEVWEPNVFITRRPIVGRDKMPFIWLHDYSVFQEDYELKTFKSQEDKNYVIDIYTRRDND